MKKYLDIKILKFSINKNHTTNISKIGQKLTRLRKLDKNTSFFVGYVKSLSNILI